MSNKRMGGSSVDANVNGVRYSDGTYQITAATGGPPGGVEGGIQFNNSSEFGGSTFQYAPTNNQITDVVGATGIVMGDLYPPSPGFIAGFLAGGNVYLGVAGAGMGYTVSRGGNFLVVDNAGNSAEMSLVNPSTFVAGSPNIALVPASGSPSYFEQGLLVIGGSISGFASIQVAAAAGTPNPLQLPLVTGTAGQVLSTNGANPQQLSWTTPSGSLNYKTVRSAPTSFTQAGVVGPIAMSFATPFADNNYTVEVTVLGDEVAPGTPTVTQFPSVGVSYIAFQTVLGAGVNVWVCNNDSIAHTGVIHVVAIHD